MMDREGTTPPAVGPAAPPTERSSSATLPPEQSPMLEKKAAVEPVLMRSTTKLIFTTWLFEIISISVALAVLTAVAAVLAIHHGRPNPVWTGGITLNTVVSFGSMLFRINLMVPVASCISQLTWIWFSQASRSLSGSVKLLLSHHVKTFAFLGAIVTVTSIGIGPFFQQSLVFYSAPVLDEAVTSYASRALAFNNTVGFTPNLLAESRGSGSDGIRVSLNMRSAVYHAFFSFGIPSSLDPPFMCPTGNCTWSPFPTLAIDVQCRDAPEQYRLDCSELEPMVFGQRSCSMRSNKEYANSTRLVLPELSTNLTANFSEVLHFTVATDNESDSPNVPEPMGWRADIQWVRVTGLQEQKHDTINAWRTYITPNSTFESKQCKLYTGVHVIKAQVDGGVYSEEIVQHMTTATFDPALLDTVINTTDGDIYRRGFNMTWNYDPGNVPSTNLTLTSRAQKIILNNFYSPFVDLNNQQIWSLKYGVVRSLTPDVLEGLDLFMMIYQTPNITDIVYSLARRTSIALRSIHTSQALQADPTLPQDFISEQERVAGLVWHDKIHVAVRWVWLALPASLLVLVVVLLTTTIWLSRAEKVGVWKDNSLALLLFSRWGDQDNSPVRDAQTQDDIREAVIGVRAQLAKDVDVGGGGFKGTMLIERVVTSPNDRIKVVKQSR